MKTAEQRYDEWKTVCRVAPLKLAERLEKIIDIAIEDGQNHLSIDGDMVRKMDFNYPNGGSPSEKDSYFQLLANVYRDHGFKVTPIQDTNCGFDDTIYWKGFDIFWEK